MSVLHATLTRIFQAIPFTSPTPIKRRLGGQCLQTHGMSPATDHFHILGIGLELACNREKKQKTKKSLQPRLRRGVLANQNDINLFCNDIPPQELLCRNLVSVPYLGYQNGRLSFAYLDSAFARNQGNQRRQVMEIKDGGMRIC